MRPDALLATGRRLWIGSLLWIIGRTLCRAARVDEAVRRELAPLPDGLTIRLEVNGMTRGLSLYKFAGRWHCGEEAGRAHSTCAHDGPHPLRVRFKHPAVAFRALSFRLVLPAFIARPLLRHYPDPHRKLARACHIYLGLLTG